jgi:hypothetical protein
MYAQTNPVCLSVGSYSWSYYPCKRSYNQGVHISVHISTDTIVYVIQTLFVQNIGKGSKGVSALNGSDEESVRKRKHSKLINTLPNW